MVLISWWFFSSIFFFFTFLISPLVILSVHHKRRNLNSVLVSKKREKSQRISLKFSLFFSPLLFESLDYVVTCQLSVDACRDFLFDVKDTEFFFALPHLCPYILMLFLIRKHVKPCSSYICRKSTSSYSTISLWKIVKMADENRKFHPCEYIVLIRFAIKLCFFFVEGDMLLFSCC